MEVAFITVVPSPYQRDLFQALAAEPEIDLRVFYLEKSAPDSPWPEAPLRSYESILPGTWIGRGPVRTHLNRLPAGLARFDVVVLNTIVSLTAQRLIRGPLRKQKWIFWGERLRAQPPGWRRIVQHSLTAPLGRARAIAAIGTLAEVGYRSRFPGMRLANIPYHTDLRPFQILDRPASATFTFLFCGQMIPRKGFDLLLAAFAELAKSHSHARLLLVGRPDDAELHLARLAPEVREKITQAGFQAPADLSAFFARADAFVLPSRHDGWGVVVNQALAAGLPLICSEEVGAAHDLIEPGVNGLRIPAGDGPALTAALRQLIDDPAQARKWGAESRVRSAAWSPEAGARKWVELLEAVHHA